MQQRFNFECGATLIPLQTVGSKSPLFCIPGGGGDATEFSELAALMPQDQPVYAIRTAIQSQENVTVHRLASVCLRAIQQKQAQGPYHLVGYSLGGLIAYEMAAQLADRGQKIGLVALFDVSNPAHAPQQLSFAQSVGSNATYMTSRLKKYLRNLRLGKIDNVVAGIRVFARYKWQKTTAFFIRTSFRMLKLPVPAQTQIWSAMDRVYRSYVAPDYNGPLVLFRAKDGDSKYDENLTMGWERHARGVIDVHFLPGDHWTILTKASRPLAEKLMAYMRD